MTAKQSDEGLGTLINFRSVCTVTMSSSLGEDLYNIAAVIIHGAQQFSWQARN